MTNLPGEDTQSSRPTKPGSNALTRCLGVAGALFLTLSSITPASSVFAIVPGVIAQAGTGAFLSMAAAALLSVPITYVYAELASAFPIAGGEYCMVGRTLGKGAGFATLGMTIFSSVLSPAALALGAGTYIDVVIPGLNGTLVAVGIIVTTTILAILRVRTNAWITGTFLLLELIALAVLTALGLWNIKRSVFEIAMHPVWLRGGALQATPLTMIGLATVIAIFAYDGSGSVIYFAEEMQDARNRIARAIFLALGITVLTELLPVTAVLLGAPDLKSLIGTGNPFNEFVNSVGGHTLNLLVSTGVALAIVNAVLATILQNARFFYCTGRDTVWQPLINGALNTTHPRFNSPWIATLISGAGSVFACFLGLNVILVLTGTGIAIVYVAICFAAISGRRSGTSDHAAYRMPLYPLPPIVALIALGYIFYTSALDPIIGQPGILASAAVISLSLAYYWLVLRKGGRWILREPE